MLARLSTYFFATHMPWPTDQRPFVSAENVVYGWRPRRWLGWMSVNVGIGPQKAFVAGIVCQSEKSSENVCFTGETPTLYSFVVDVPTKIGPRFCESVRPSASLQPLKFW